MSVASLFARTDRELWLLTAAAAGRRGGLIATFVSQASIVPDLPRVVVGIAKQHHTRELIEASGAFALHLLGEEHLDWVWRFGLRSGRDIDKLDGLSTIIAATGSPILTDALGWLDCCVESRMDTGDRTVYLAAVLRGETTREAPALTAQRMMQLAPPERLRELKEQMTRDIDIDRAAMRAGARSTMNSADDALPALLGGPPVRPQGPPDWPLPDEDVLRSLQSAYADGSWGKYSGPFVARLEERLAEDHGVAHALTCGSGTFAVELALRALKVGPGDEVILSAYDYPGNFLNVHAVGAVPVLVDLDPASWQMALDRLPAAVSPATKVILASHLHGGQVPMAALMAFAAERGLRVIEDAAQCPGAVVQGRRAGTWGDVGILSFGGSKLLSAGRGGALLTSHADVHQRARVGQMRGNIVCPLSELQAAALLPQLDKLAVRHRQRLAAVEQLTSLLRDVPGLRPLGGLPESESGYYKVGFQYDETAFGLSRQRFVAAARAEGMAFDDGFRSLHAGRSPSRFRRIGDLTEADRAHRGVVVLHHPVLLGSEADVREIADAVRKICAHFRRTPDE